MGDMLCWDEKGKLLARFEACYWSVKKKGTLELEGISAAQGSEAINKIVVAGLAMVEYRKRQQRRGNRMV